MKTVSIIGSCNSRELFNYYILKNEFQIDFYAFQTNLWDMFSSPLDVDMSFINQIPMEQFYRRMFDLDVNKKIINQLKEKKSEYFVVDFYILSQDTLRITKNNRSVFINNVSYNRIHNYITNRRDSNISSRIIRIKDIDRDIILNGLDNLAEFVKDNYSEEKIIVVYPVFCTKYCNEKGIVVPYPQEEVDRIKQKQEEVYYYSDYFMSKLSKAKKFVLQSTTEYATYKESDLGVIRPNPVHRPKYQEVDNAYQLYNVIFDKNVECNGYNYLTHEYDRLMNKAYKLVNIVFKTTFDTITSLNNYVYKILNLDRYIVAISAKDEASAYLQKFISKSKLNLKFQIAFRQSYIGIVDKRGDYFFEQSSDAMLEKKYSIRKNVIEIKSAGFCCGNVSSIKVNGIEYSKNRRGLNFVIIDNQSFEVVNQFSCDIHADENLLITLNPKY